VHDDRTFQLRSLEDLGSRTPVEIARVASRAFSDYAVPLRLGPPDIEDLIQRDDIDLGASVALQQGGAMVGLALLARREAKGRIAMMGIDPLLRGRGGGRLLGERAIEVLRAGRVTRIVLEVLDGNEVAGSLYRSLGFHPARRLVGRTRHPAPPRPTGRGSGLELAPIDLAESARALAAHGDTRSPLAARAHHLVGCRSASVRAWRRRVGLVADAERRLGHAAGIAGRPPVAPSRRGA